MKEILKNGVHIIFGGSKEQRSYIVNEILRQDINYKVEINEAFAYKKKIGPFTIKNKKSVWQILQQNKTIKQLDPAFVIKQAKNISVYQFIDRRPIALSYIQRERVSILYDVLCGKNKLLLHDEGKFQDHYFIVASWVNQIEIFKKNNGSMIWITEFNMDSFLDYLNQQHVDLSQSLDFYHIENNHLVKKEVHEVEMIENQPKAIVASIEEMDMFGAIEVELLLQKGKFKAGDQLICARNHKVIRIPRKFSVLEKNGYTYKSEADAKNTKYLKFSIDTDFEDIVDVGDNLVKY